MFGRQLADRQANLSSEKENLQVLKTQVRSIVELLIDISVYISQQ